MRLERHNKQTNRKIQGSDSAKKKIVGKTSHNQRSPFQRVYI